MAPHQKKLTNKHASITHYSRIQTPCHRFFFTPHAHTNTNTTIMPSNLFKILVSDNFFTPELNALADSPISAGLFPVQDPKALQDLYFPANAGNLMMNMNINLNEQVANFDVAQGIADASSYVNEKSLNALSKLFSGQNCLEDEEKKLDRFLASDDKLELENIACTSAKDCSESDSENGDNDVPNQSSSGSAIQDEKDDFSETAIDPSRVFSLVEKDSNFAFDETKDKIKIEIKTRREKPNPLIPDRLYSSLKYQLKQTATGKFCQSLPFLHSVATVVDGTTFERIKKNGNDVLKGTIECSLAKPGKTKTCELRGEMCIQFTDLSFHHDRKVSTLCF